jgi:hypothetical protein
LCKTEVACIIADSCLSEFARLSENADVTIIADPAKKSTINFFID